MGVVLVVAMRGWLTWVGPAPGDRWAAGRFADPASNPALIRHITGLYQALGTPVPAIVLVGAAALALLYLNLPRELVGLLLATSGVAVSAIMKLIWGPTPVWAAAGHQGSNFPSGHTVFATTVFGYLGIVAARHGQRTAALTAALLVAGMGVARVLGGQHLPSDVLGGYVLGGAWLWLALRWLGVHPGEQRLSDRSLAER